MAKYIFIKVNDDIFKSEDVSNKLNNNITNIINYYIKQLKDIKNNFIENMNNAKDVYSSMYITLCKKYNKELPSKLEAIIPSLNKLSEFINNLSMIDKEYKEKIYEYISDIKKRITQSHSIFVSLPKQSNNINTFYSYFEREFNDYQKPITNDFMSLQELIKNLFN